MGLKVDKMVLFYIVKCIKGIKSKKHNCVNLWDENIMGIYIF